MLVMVYVYLRISCVVANRHDDMVQIKVHQVSNIDVQQMFMVHDLNFDESKICSLSLIMKSFEFWILNFIIFISKRLKHLRLKIIKHFLIWFHKFNNFELSNDPIRLSLNRIIKKGCLKV